MVVLMVHTKFYTTSGQARGSGFGTLECLIQVNIIWNLKLDNCGTIKVWYC